MIERLHGAHPLRGSLFTNIANEAACKKKDQHIDADLNRVFPGKEDGNYEECLAHAMMQVIPACDVVCDIHSTNTLSLGKESALIVTHFTPETHAIIECIRPPKVIIMHATKDNALISGAPVGIGFEYECEDDEGAISAVEEDIRKILFHYGMAEKDGATWHDVPTEYYEIYGIFPKEKGDVLEHSIKNYTQVSAGDVVAKRGADEVRADEDFYPFLFGENRYTDMFGFTARKVDGDAIASLYE